MAPAQQAAAAKENRREDPSLPADTPITPFDSPQARAIEKEALAAKDRPVDWLYDEGQLAYRNGRLLDAYRLLQAAASRAEEEMKLEEAARQWEQVQALTLDNEAMHARARTEAARLHARVSR